MKKPAEHIRRIGLIGNSSKSQAARVVSRAAQLITAAGREIFCDPETSRLARLRGTICPDAASLSRQVDLLLVFGGDGTMLRVARQIAGSRTPMLGINIGGLGFLTAVPSSDLAAALKAVWAGQFTFEGRMLLQVSGTCQGKRVEWTALNDIVMSRGVASRLIELEVRIDREPLTRYRCDGLIVSSPTGSTAYALAAGGAVVFPNANVLSLTPICPHTLSNRALIIPARSTIEAAPITVTPATILAADGEVVSELAAGDTVTIRRSNRNVRLMHLAGSSFCDTLRRKLHWRGAYL